MKNTDKGIFYEYSYPTIGNKIINLLIAVSSNAIIVIQLVLPLYLAIALLIDEILYKTIEFKNGFITFTLFFIFGWFVLDLLYIFTKKGVYIYNDNKISIKNGYFVRGNFYSLKGIKYTFYTWQIKNINIYSDKGHFTAWETQMYIAKWQNYIVIELINNNRIAFAVEDPLGLVDEIIKRKNK